MKRAVIFGTGSFGELADLYLRLDGGYDVIAFAATADQALKQPQFKNRPVLSLDELPKRIDPAEVEVFVAVGYRQMNSLRQDFCGRIKAAGYRLLSYVNSKVKCWPGMELGENVFVFEDNTLQPFTRIGDGVVMWSGNHFGHHSVIENWCFITSHTVISGHCRIGEASFLGVNCTLADGVIVGPRNLIGPGALIQKNTGPDEAWFTERASKFPKASSYFMK